MQPKPRRRAPRVLGQDLGHPRPFHDPPLCDVQAPPQLLHGGIGLDRGLGQLVLALGFGLARQAGPSLQEAPGERGARQHLPEDPSGVQLSHLPETPDFHPSHEESRQLPGVPGGEHDVPHPAHRDVVVQEPPHLDEIPHLAGRGDLALGNLDPWGPPVGARGGRPPGPRGRTEHPAKHGGARERPELGQGRVEDPLPQRTVGGQEGKGRRFRSVVRREVVALGAEVLLHVRLGRDGGLPAVLRQVEVSVRPHELRQTRSPVLVVVLDAQVRQRKHAGGPLPLARPLRRSLSRSARLCGPPLLLPLPRHGGTQLPRTNSPHSEPLHTVLGD
mmetsp:Transcript_1966/g.6584  ORF Transcript_1966/g.6584 Transcript_1966/m.6584 type:complete len:331 (-) Transcript_1966:17-1009(-)